MSRRLPLILALMGLFAGLTLATTPSYAAKPVAKITSFQGEVRVLAGSTIRPVKQKGVVLNHGDRVQTEQGTVEVTFLDGATMKVRPYTTAMIQEQEEETGWWIFKGKQAVRRVTCFVGKLWFKSGASDRKNYLQTPTAVCGIRGSDGDIGYDNLNTYLNMYSGEVAIIGEVLQGFFDDPGISAAEKNRVYKGLEQAYQKTQQAQQTGRAKDQALAKKDALGVGKVAAEILQEKNPDGEVKNDAECAKLVAEAGIAAADAEVSVEELRELVEAAEKAAEEAEARGDTEGAEKAREAALAAKQSLQQAEQMAQQAENLAAQAGVVAEVTRNAAATKNLADAAKRQAENAKAQAQQGQQGIQEVVTTVETTAETTVETTEETTVETTTSSSTTSSTTTTTTTSEETTISPSS